MILYRLKLAEGLLSLRSAIDQPVNHQHGVGGNERLVTSSTTSTLNETVRNDFKLGRNDFELGRTDLGLNGPVSNDINRSFFLTSKWNALISIADTKIP